MSQDDIARVTVIAPNRRIDLALPGEALLGELLPSIVRFSGHEGATTGEVVHTWVLQRVGEDALDPNRMVSALGIRDGETLHLRQRESAMPDAAFDDVVDAVATTASARPSWTSSHSQRLALACLVLVLVGGAAAVLFTDHSVGAALAVLGLAVAAGVAAIVTSRAYGRLAVSATLSWCCVGLAALAGLAYMAPLDISPLALLGRPDQWSQMLLVAAALGLLAAATMALAAHVQVHALLTTCVTLLLLAFVAMALAFLPHRLVEVCAVGVAILLALTPLLPWLSYSIAQIAMPNLPSQVELLMADDQPVQSDVVARATTADRLLACFLTATAVVTAALCVPLVAAGTLPALLLTSAVALSLLLRARAFVGLTQRLVLLLGGVAVAAMTAGWVMLHPADGALRLLLCVLVMAALGWALAHYAAQFYAKIMAPIWGRLGDILEWTAIIAVIPLVLWILNVYSLARGLPG